MNPPRPLAARPCALPLLVSLLCACQVAAPSSQQEPSAESAEDLVLAPGEVVVSINFDDGLAEQADAGVVLVEHGMRGTFYVNSGRLGLPGYLTYGQLRGMQDAGHEIGGHTISMPRLTTLDPDSQRRQVCDDRVALMDAGLRITSFSYPFGDEDATTRQIVIDCNYNSARESGGLRTPDSCTSCPYAESVPPRDAYTVRTHGSAQPDWTLADLQALVLRAEEAGGGWVPIVFHRLCDPCDPAEVYATPWPTFRAFLDWLQPRASRGTFVRTMDQVIGGTMKPPVSGPPVDGGTPTPTQLLKNPSLEADSNGDGTPDCWQRGGFGTNSYSWARTTDAHSGSWAQRVTITSISSGDRKLISLEDLGACAPALTTGHRYRVSGWYKANAATRFKAYYRTTSGAWQYWTQGPLLPTRSSYTFAEWTTPAAPSGATGLSVGLSLDRVGSLTMDDFTLTDLGAATFQEAAPNP